MPANDTDGIGTIRRCDIAVGGVCHSGNTPVGKVGKSYQDRAISRRSL
ncbi:MAG: hypothetical protein HZA46_01590 [Planctomycetales bacterium]|nr:hypothetical protein [Planctomycetales bacterium]